jgi:hypothetical protein
MGWAHLFCDEARPSLQKRQRTTSHCDLTQLGSFGLVRCTSLRASRPVQYEHAMRTAQSGTHRKGRVLNWGSQSITLFNCLLYSGCSGGFATESVSCELLGWDRSIGRTPGTQTQDSVWGSASWGGKEAVCNLRECICPTRARESTGPGLHWSSKNGGPPVPMGGGGRP